MEGGRGGGSGYQNMLDCDPTRFRLGLHDAETREICVRRPPRVRGLRGNMSLPFHSSRTSPLNSPL